MRLTILLILVCVTGCKSAGSPQSPEATTNCPEVLRQAQAAGVDYVSTLRRADRGDEAALSALFQLTGTDHLSADAQQCHIEALAELLNRLGDRQFSVTLANESPEVRRAVVNGLIVELDNLPTAAMSRRAFANEYPHTADTLSE